MVFCARDLSLTARAFWRAEQLRCAEANFEEMRKVDQCSDEMKTVEKNLLRWHVRRDGMRWEEVRRAQMRWDQIRWDEVRWSVECEVQVWSVKKVFTWRCIAQGRAQVTFLDNNSATGSRKAHTHGPGSRTARASSIDEKGFVLNPERNFRPASCGYYWLNSIRQWSKHRLINLYRSIFSGWNAFLSSRSNWKLQGKYSINKKRIRRPAGVSCGSCLFVVVLSVLSLCLSRLSLWRGFLPCLTWTHAPLPPCLLHLRFVFIFPYVALGSTLPTPRSTPAWFCTSCCHFDGCFHLSCCVCHGFAPSLLVSKTWSTGFCAEHLLRAYLSINGLSLIHNPGLHICFGLNLNRGLNKSHVFASKLSFTQKKCYTPLFAACRIALSMVDGGARRRRLNRTWIEIWEDLGPGFKII